MQRPSLLRPRCVCTRLHYGCNPDKCDTAARYRWSPLFRLKKALKRHLDMHLRFSFTRGELWKAATYGCVTCGILHRGISDHSTSVGYEIDYEIDYESKLRIDRAAGSLTLEMPSGDVFEYLQPAISMNCTAIPIGAFASFSTGSDTAFDICKTWIKNCKDQHPICTVQYLPELPRRVVDIGYSNKSFSPHLCESNGNFDEYTTLSHCWGGTQPLTTSSSTLASRKKGIPWDQLPKTFQDAIVITQALGIRYIWIDSLCIIQDDFMDWAVESKKMAGIYEASTVMIAAAKAKDGGDGCFSNGRQSKTISLPFPNPRNPNPVHPTEQSKIYVRKRPRHDGFANSRQDQYNESLCLFGRAWTLQEELLACRVIYYARDELVWQCRTSIDCHCGYISKDLRSYKQNTSKMNYEAASRRDLNGDTLKSQWAKILEQYSVRHLTMETDRLPALSGLAKAFQSRGLGSYLAGLWTEDLALWLTWRVDQGCKKLKKCPFIAPSWSWASIPSGRQIYFDIFEDLSKYGRKDLELKTQIVSSNCTLATSDPTGGVQAGNVTVTGLVAAATLIARGHPRTIVLRRDGLECRHFSPDYTNEAMLGWDRKIVLCLVLCIFKEMVYFVVLMPSGDVNKFKRIGSARSSLVTLPGASLNGPCAYSIMSTWFKHEDQGEIMII